ncbi:MAG TPA: hypothetical protein PLH94_06030 [Fimbriimonadaceae bacterium]|nr:hypothetical protein [Fimbriimonadaceae bacterium]
MSDLAAIWNEILPEVKNGVTGVGVWAALNAARPVASDGDVLILGVPHESAELGGHLRLPATRSIIERLMSEVAGAKIQLRVIEGVTEADWHTVQRRDAERRRLQEQAMDRLRQESEARTSWDTIYEQLSRKYAAIQNKSMPQNRAKFFIEAVEYIADARSRITTDDDLSERNYARCLERVSQYTELPSVLVALKVLEAMGESDR